MAELEVTGAARSILAINCGSSSLKFGLYEIAGENVEPLMEGEGEELGSAQATFWFKAANGDKQSEPAELPDHRAAIARALDKIRSMDVPLPTAVGHRIVHGGPTVNQHQLLTPAILGELEGAADFAPLHVPPALKAIAAISKELPNTTQAVCLDTAFHTTIPDVSRTFALPERVTSMGVHRYGFHGISLESILPQLSPLPNRLVVAHLGGGCSITAIQRGKSIDTTMGLTPTGGMMMGTRTGDLDPGVVLYLMRNGLASADELEKLIDTESGLKGVSGLSSDLRELEKAQPANAQADLARRMFSYQLRKAIASMAAALGGIDMLVFTGGIGEHNASLRDEVTGNLRFLGSFEVTALPSLEDAQIAKITARLSSEKLT